MLVEQLVCITSSGGVVEVDALASTAASSVEALAGPGRTRPYAQHPLVLDTASNSDSSSSAAAVDRASARLALPTPRGGTLMMRSMLTSSRGLTSTRRKASTSLTSRRSKKVSPPTMS